MMFSLHVLITLITLSYNFAVFSPFPIRKNAETTCHRGVNMVIRVLGIFIINIYLRAHYSNTQPPYTYANKRKTSLSYVANAIPPPIYRYGVIDLILAMNNHLILQTNKGNK